MKVAKVSVQRVTEQTATLQSGQDIAEKGDERVPQNHERCGDIHIMFTALLIKELQNT